MPSFKDIIGQDRALSVITATLKGGRVPNAFLFLGMEGVGKMKTALTLASALNCTEAGPGDGCMTCPSCLKVERGTHPDVIHVYPQSESLDSPQEENIIAPQGEKGKGEYIKIEQAKELVSALSFVPFEGKMKVAIIDRAEKMTWSAGNALLKVLEEPPPKTLLILLATRQDALPSTILSRCQRVKFAPLKTEDIVGWLMKHKEIPAEKASLISAMSEGSLGRAAMVDDKFLERRRKIFEQVLHARDRVAKIFDIAKGFKKKDIEEFLRIVEGLLTDLIWVWLRREERVKNRDFVRELADAAIGDGIPGIVRAYETIGTVRNALVRNVNPQLAAETVLLSALPQGVNK